MTITFLCSSLRLHESGIIKIEQCGFPNTNNWYFIAIVHLYVATYEFFNVNLNLMWCGNDLKKTISFLF